MWRFVVLMVLAFGIMVCLLPFANYTQQCAFITGFGAVVLLPLVRDPSRDSARNFFLCFDTVYVAACAGAYLASRVTHASWLEIFTAGLVPALLFATAASVRGERSRRER